MCTLYFRLFGDVFKKKEVGILNPKQNKINQTKPNQTNKNTIYCSHIGIVAEFQSYLTWSRFLDNLELNI